jgi:hypothetical protein
MPSGMHVYKMADNTWSIATGPIEDMPTGQSKWIGHYHRTLNDAKSSVGMHFRRSKKTESEPSQERLRDLFDQVAFTAAKNKSYRRGAAEFHALGTTKQIEHFNSHIIPLYQQGKHTSDLDFTNKVMDHLDNHFSKKT